MESYFHSTFLAWDVILKILTATFLTGSQFLPAEFPFFPGREIGETAGPCLLHKGEDDFLFLFG